MAKGPFKMKGYTYPGTSPLEQDLSTPPVPPATVNVPTPAGDRAIDTKGLAVKLATGGLFGNINAAPPPDTTGAGLPVVNPNDYVAAGNAALAQQKAQQQQVVQPQASSGLTYKSPAKKYKSAAQRKAVHASKNEKKK